MTSCCRRVHGGGPLRGVPAGRGLGVHIVALRPASGAS